MAFLASASGNPAPPYFWEASQRMSLVIFISGTDPRRCHLCLGRRGQVQPDRAGFRPLAALDYVNGDALPRVEVLDTGTLKYRGVHEDVLSAIVPNDEAEPLGGTVPFHGAGPLDTRLRRRPDGWRTKTGRRCLGPAGRPVPRIVVRSIAVVPRNRRATGSSRPPRPPAVVPDINLCLFPGIFLSPLACAPRPLGRTPDFRGSGWARQFRRTSRVLCVIQRRSGPAPAIVSVRFSRFANQYANRKICEEIRNGNPFLSNQPTAREHVLPSPFRRKSELSCPPIGGRTAAIQPPEQARDGDDEHLIAQMASEGAEMVALFPFDLERLVITLGEQVRMRPPPLEQPAGDKKLFTSVPPAFSQIGCRCGSDVVQ